MLLQHSGQHKDKVIKWAEEDVNGHEEEKSKEFQSVAAKRDADDNEKQWMKHFTYGCQELMYSNELMPTPFMLLYIIPIVVNRTSRTTWLDITSSVSLIIYYHGLFASQSLGTNDQTIDNK